MTLVAFTLEPGRAEVVTDGLSYSEVDFAPVSKCDVFPEWDLAVAAIGPSELGETWRKSLCDVVGQVADLDEIDRYTPEALRELWRLVVKARGGRMTPGADTGRVFHVGWSPARDRFVAYAYAIEDDFERTDLTQHRLFCCPTPWSGPPAGIPSTPKQWAQLVKAAHADWTLAPAVVGHGLGKVYIGGDVVRTRLARGVHDQQVIHTFPMRGAQWRRAVIAHLSPEGQMGPCPCGSGLPYCACHLRLTDLARPCPCGSEQPFEHCHLLQPDDHRVQAYYRQHRQDYVLLRPELAAAYRRARPAENWPPAEILHLRHADA